MNFKSVLIVDDSEVVSATLTALLEDEGYFVRSAATLPVAYEMLSHTAFTFVVLDINLGSERGPDLIPYIREYAPDARIVVFSGENEDVPGADAIQSKGDDISRLLSVLEAQMPKRDQLLEKQLRHAMRRIGQLVEQNRALVDERDRLAAELEVARQGPLEQSFSSFLKGGRGDA